MSLSLIAHTVLQKAALDEGFDIELSEADGWLRFESTQTPVAIALTGSGGPPVQGWVAAISAPAVVAELRRSWPVVPTEALSGYAAAFRVPDAAALHRLLVRARMLGRSLPTRPFDRFIAKSRSLPHTTEAERLVVQRVGQDVFREALIEFWHGRCPLTGIDEPLLLRASHIKPWADCATDAERLDVYNGLLLAAHLDAAFDAGLITFTADGGLVVSPRLSAANAARLGLAQPTRLCLSPPHLSFLEWHRHRVFRP